MNEVLRHRGRSVSSDEIAEIRQLIADNPGASRRDLSKRLCEKWNWRQPNGALRDMVCRGLMLALDRAGHIELPPVRYQPPNPFLEKRHRDTIEIDESPIELQRRGKSDPPIGALVIHAPRRRLSV